MTPDRFVQAEESWVTVAAVARCYQVEVRLLVDACEAGYLVHTTDEAGVLAVSVRDLGRVAVLVRLHVYQGISLDAVGLYLELRHN